MSRERLFGYAVVLLMGMIVVFGLATILLPDFRANGATVIGVILTQALGLCALLGGNKIAEAITSKGEPEQQKKDGGEPGA